MMETMIDHLATSLGMDVEVVKVTNLYKNGHMTLVGKELTNCNMSRIWERELQCIYEYIHLKFCQQNQGRILRRGHATHPILRIIELSIDLFLELPTQKRPRVTFDRTR